MSAFRLCFGAACAVLMLSAGGFAQAPSTAAVIPKEEAVWAMLLSGEPKQVAWGAYYVAAGHYESLVPDLLTLADQWERLKPQDGVRDFRPYTSEQKDKQDAQAEVLDTLIQLNAAVPAETLRKLAPEFQNEVAVLLSQMPADEATPLANDFYRSPPEGDVSLQYVSAALLALHPVPEFVADLLSRTRVWINVTVVSSGSERTGWGGASDCFPSSDSPRDGWPVIGQYKLSWHKDENGGATVLVPGIDPVYVTRELLNRYRGYFCPIPYLGPEQRRRLAAEMLGISPDAIPWETSGSVSIVFRTTQQLRRRLLTFAAAEQAKYRKTTAALVGRGLLTPSEAEDALPSLRLNLLDNCSRCTFPTPSVPLTQVEVTHLPAWSDPNE